MTARISATELRLALSEIYPEATYGAVPVIDQYEALAAYRAFNDGARAKAPYALAAYIGQHRHDID